MVDRKINFVEETFLFEEEREKGLFDNDQPGAIPNPEVHGITIRLGNSPIIRNLKDLLERANSQIPDEIHVLFKEKDIYLITHAIGVIRTSGSAKVKQLQFNGEVVGLPGCQTIDLLPNTSFANLFSVSSSFEASFGLEGNFSATVPDELKQALSNDVIILGAGVELQLSNKTQFIGKLKFTVQLPIVNSSGISTNMCTWILNPANNPLLGDQLLIQTLSVPKGTASIMFNLKGVVKVKKGLFSGIEEKETSTYTINVNLKS